MYKIIFGKNRAYRYVKKASDELQICIKEEILKIAELPYSNELLSGKFKGIRSHHFKLKGIDYRIAYHINEQTKTVEVAHIGTRENFYKELKEVI